MTAPHERHTESQEGSMSRPSTPPRYRRDAARRYLAAPPGPPPGFSSAPLGPAPEGALEATRVVTAGESAIDLSGFFDEDKRLSRPRPRRGQSGISALLQLSDEIGDNNLAPTTRDRYGWGAMAWITWCKERDLPAVPATTEAVKGHLTEFAVAFDDNGQPLKDVEGRLVQRTSVSSVHNRLQAINKLHVYAGFAEPGKSRDVAEFMRGLRRTFPVRPRRAKAALDYDKLCLILEQADNRPASLRQRAWVLLRARLEVSVGRMARIDWEDVVIGAHGLTLTTHETGRASPITKTVARHPDRQICVAAALEDLAEYCLPTGPVFVIKGRRAAERTAHYAVSKVAGTLGWVGLPGASDDELRAMVADPGARTRLTSTRNRALLTATWWMAMRRSNAVMLRWEDLRWDDKLQAWEVTQRRSKVDQEGRGTTLWLPLLSDPHTCPARAMRHWHQAITETLGADPITSHPRMPVFPQITYGGNIRWNDGRPLNGETLNQLVQDLVVRAGLWRPTQGQGQQINPYGAHSLRAGFVTEATRDGKLTLPEIAAVTQHASMEVLLAYAREQSNATNNPARKLDEGLRRLREQQND